MVTRRAYLQFTSLALNAAHLLSNDAFNDTNFFTVLPETQSFNRCLEKRHDILGANVHGFEEALQPWYQLAMPAIKSESLHKAKQ